MKTTVKRYLHASLKPILIIIIAASSPAIFTCSALADSSPATAQPTASNQNTMVSWQNFQGPRTTSMAPAKEVIVNVEINPAETFKNITTAERMIMVNPAAMLCSPGAKIDVMRLIIATNNRSGRDPLNHCMRFTSVSIPTKQSHEIITANRDSDAQKSKPIPIKTNDTSNVLQHAVNTKDLSHADSILLDGDDIVIMGAS